MSEARSSASGVASVGCSSRSSNSSSVCRKQKRSWSEEKSSSSTPEPTRSLVEEESTDSVTTSTSTTNSSCKPPKRARTTSSRASSNTEAEEGTTTTTCCICMCAPSRRDLSGLNSCRHMYCWDCISTWSKRENSCPLCKARFTQITRLHPIRTTAATTTTSIINTLQVAPRNQEPPGTRLTLQGPDGIELVLWTPAGMPPHVVRAVRNAFSQRLARGEFTIQQTGGSLTFTELFTAPRGAARVRLPPRTNSNNNNNNNMIPGTTPATTQPVNSRNTGTHPPTQHHV